MPTQLSNDLLSSYFTGQKKNPVADKYNEMASAMKVHSEGCYPKAMIEERRPSESPETKKYREKIFKAVTKIPFNKILTELTKIRKSEEWNIAYDSTKFSAKLREGERLQDYCENNYPSFGSVTNWVFQVLLKTYSDDPNAVVLVLPKSMEVEENEFLEPYALIFGNGNVSHVNQQKSYSNTNDSTKNVISIESQVIEFINDDYCILKSKDKSTFNSADGQTTFTNGDIYYVVNEEYIQRWEEVSPVGDKRTWKCMINYEHGLDEMPAFQIGAVIVEMREKYMVYESRLQSTTIELDEASREYSDLQAEVVQHIHSEKWVYSNQECKSCSGTGKILTEGTSPVQAECPKCKGQGIISTSPYQHLLLRPAGLGEQSVPTPPIGYVQKGVEIVKIQDERIDAHIYKGLSAINMEFLAETPLNQSGTAKEVDRDGLNTFVNAVAEDLVNVMDKVYYFINEYRNHVVIPDEKERLLQLPTIEVPEHFDSMFTNNMVDQITKARNANLHPALITAMEKDYANSQFSANQDIRKRLDAIYNIDPFAGVNDAEKMSRLSNGGISKLDYIISSNIVQYVDQAIFENTNFFQMDAKEQYAILQKYGKVQLAAATAAAKVMAGLAQDVPAKAGSTDIAA